MGSHGMPLIVVGAHRGAPHDQAGLRIEISGQRVSAGARMSSSTPPRAAVAERPGWVRVFGLYYQTTGTDRCSTPSSLPIPLGRPRSCSSNRD